MITEPFLYQAEDVARIDELNGRALVAGEMGIGKSLEALLYCFDHPSLRPIVVVCPKSLKWNWAKEARIHIGMKAIILDKSKPPTKTLPYRGNLYIINYDILGGWLPFLLKLKPQVVIADEVHMLKGRTGVKRVKYFKQLCKDVPHILALSGTPLVNRPAELWNIVHLLRPDVFDSWPSYGTRYCEPKLTRWGLQYDGASHLEELHDLLTSTCFPYKILIETEIGPIPIGEIVENELPIRVLAINVETSEVSWRPIKAYSKRIAPHRMVRIRHEKGEFDCTPDHRIWTEKGWLRAEAIIPGLHLFTLQKTKEDLVHKILFNQVCSNSSRRNRRVKEKDGVDKMEKRDHRKKINDLSTMWKKKFNKNKTRNTFLQYFLCDEMAWIPSVGSSISGMETHSRSSSRASQTNHRKNEGCRKEDRGQITREDFFRGNMCKNVYWSNKKVEKFKERKRWTLCGPHHPRNQKKVITTTEQRTLDISKSFECSRRTNGNPNPLRHKFYLRRYCNKQSDNRNRWTNTYICRTKANRSRTGSETTRSRVHSVEILELGHQREVTRSPTENQFVYDLEIDKDNTFFANNVLVHNCMIRRLKKDVLSQLPPKSRFVVPLPLDNPKEYKDAQNDFIGWLKKQNPGKARRAKKAQSLVRLGYLKRLASQLKINSVFDWVDNFLEDTDEKLLIFCIHKAILHPLYDRYKNKATYIDGSVTGESRQQAVDTFQKNTKCRIFIGQIQAAGVGITLTAASTVVFAELDWVPGNMTQCEDRVHRIGQKSEKVQIFYLVAHNTIEEKLCEILQTKQEILDATLDGNTTGIATLNVFDELEKELRRGFK